MPDELPRASPDGLLRIAGSADWREVRGRGTNGKGCHVDPAAWSTHTPNVAGRVRCKNRR